MSENATSRPYINNEVKGMLKELIASARQRKSKSYPLLCEAYSSLKACPIRFTSLKQLLPLAGFGEALLNQLETKLNEKIKSVEEVSLDAEAGSSTLPQDLLGQSDNEESSSDLDIRAPVKRANCKGKSKAKAKEAPKKPHRQAKKKEAEKAPKIFVPQHRTGTHGILVSLYTLTPDMPAMEAEDSADANSDAGIHYYSKATVIRFGQPYSDSKYIPKTNPISSNGFGTNFHSAWSGMKTLINRGYVYRRGNPARFGLSHAGWEVAQICSEREQNLSSGCNVGKLESVPSTSTNTSEEKTKKKRAASSEATNASKSAVSVLSEPFLYTYLTDSLSPEQTTIREQASIRLNDEDYRMVYKITFVKALKDHPFVKSCVQDVTIAGDLMIGWVKEAVCNKVAPGIAQPSTSKAISTSKRKSNSKETSEEAPRPPLKSVAEQENISAKDNGFPQSQELCSQSNVIDLLTSSDVEIEEDRCKIKVRTWTSNRRQKSESDSDSALSDLAPLVKQRKFNTKERLVRG